MLGDWAVLRAPLAVSPAYRGLGAVLCAFVVAIHVVDQGGPLGMSEPDYVGYLYYALELGGALTVLLLLVPRGVLFGWFCALLVALGPLVGYLSSRSIGLPGYTDDIGNWTEPLGLCSLAVEGLLLIWAVAALVSVVGGRRRT